MWSDDESLDWPLGRAYRRAAGRGLVVAVGPLVLLTWILVPGGAHQAEPRAEPDRQAVTREATEVLRELISMRTVNPPGAELMAARYLAERLRAAGIEATVRESSRGRGNVMARLRGDGSKRPMLLLCHLDVVPVEEGWTVDPFAGVVHDGAVYGRGAIDDKSMCATNLVAFLELRRQAVVLARDVVFLATADEEAVGEGPQFMLEQYPEELNVEYVFNEGGAGVRDALEKGQVLFAVAAGEKGFAHLRLVARGQPGHGGIPRPDQAVDRLTAALVHLRSIEWPLVPHEYVNPLLASLGAREGGLKGFMLRHPRLIRGVLLNRLGASPQGRAALSNTINVTSLQAGGTVAVVPGVAEAGLDSRMLPGIEPETWRQQIQAEVDPFGVQVELVRGWAGTTSPWGTDFSRALERHLTEGVEGSVAAPIMSVAWTDSRFFRRRGAVAYGVFPFVLSQQELEGIHGHDERLKVSELGLGVRRTYRVVADVAGKAEP